MPKAEQMILSEFSPMQVGSITDIIESLSAKAPVTWAIDMLSKHPDYHAVPIDRDGVIIGIIDRQIVEEMNESTWSKFWQRDLDAYVKSPVEILQAFSYVEAILPAALKANEEKGINYFAVYHRQNFLGVVSLNRLVNQANVLRTQDMIRAKEVQQSLLAHSRVDDPRIAKGCFIRMAHEVGGDFYQDISFDDDHCLFACFDVSGKNLAASLTTTGIGAFFSALRYFGAGRNFRPSKLVPLMNAYLGDLIPGDTFIAALLIYVDFADGVVRIQNMGYAPVYAFIPGDEKVSCKLIKPNMPPLGIDMDEVESQSEYTLPIATEMKIIAFSDGLTDLENADRIKYGGERTQQFILARFAEPVDALIGELEDEVDKWMGKSVQKDDITFFALRFTGAAKPS
jgi:phosphoserine phosphatase RsbU/P